MNPKIHIVNRGDGRIERTCKHGIGHTILSNGFDTYTARQLLLTDANASEVINFIHGCDGCCTSLFSLEGVAEFFKLKVKHERLIYSKMVKL